MKLTTYVAAAAALLAVVPAHAQVKVNMKVGRPENFNRVDPKKMGLNNMDYRFIQSAYAANSYEAKMGQLAMSRGQDPWTRDFGTDMHREHTNANSELKQLVRSRGMHLNNNWPRMFVANYQKLSRLHGASFDNFYRKLNKSGHMMAMDLCAKEIKSGHDANVRGYATKMLASARSHEQLVMTHQTMLVRYPNSSYGTAAQPMKP